MNHSDWSKKDLEYIWHPCSQMKDYETLPPIVIDHGKGVSLYDVDGKRYLDVVSSWWCNLLGHSHPKINRAIKEQLDSLEHVIFANFSHRPAITLCEELMKKIGYPEIEAQKRAHSAFVEKLVNIDFRELEAMDDNQEEYLMDLIGFLLGWLSNHILASDKKIGKYVKEHSIEIQ